MEAHITQQTFLKNEKNKCQFIHLLSHYLEDDGHTVHQSTGDADTMIVHCVLQLATQGTEVMVVADDTDVLILLIHHWQGEMANVYFLSESSKTRKCWKIRDIAAEAGAGLVSHILFVHAWSGCDTTSATFG